MQCTLIVTTKTIRYYWFHIIRIVSLIFIIIFSLYSMIVLSDIITWLLHSLWQCAPSRLYHALLPHHVVHVCIPDREQRHFYYNVINHSRWSSLGVKNCLCVCVCMCVYVHYVNVCLNVCLCVCMWWVLHMKQSILYLSF